MPSCPADREAKATLVPRPKGLDIALSLIWFCEDMESSARAERKDVQTYLEVEVFVYVSNLTLLLPLLT